ncbi:glucosamine-6-phosphate deaminase [Limimaricola cinnabarinus LL-001]|uniref:Glucosamine-6-phosphate deaminase n=1 Tax=Limimaricola cinnabarinus LL-001 TaxID=1337093 RepID=U2Z6F7_9RHOB|nr:glucosamine-6-phosphate deaminase [Limimaricola cinnabarinus LL-001]
MKILILPDPAAAVARCVEIIAQTLNEKPQAVLGLATGGTMEPVYARLVERARAGEIALDRMTSFNLDEYVGLPPEHSQSYHSYMRDRLFGPLGLDPSRTHLPRGDAPDPAAEARALMPRSRRRAASTCSFSASAAMAISASTNPAPRWPRRRGSRR